MAIEARDPLGQRPCPASGSSHPKRSTSLARASSSHSSLRCNTCPHPARRTDPARRPRLHGSRGAEQLDTSIPSVNSALQRARTKVDHGGQTNRRCYVNSAITRSPRSSPAGSKLGTLTTSMQSSRCSPMTCGTRCRQCPSGITAWTTSGLSAPRPAAITLAIPAHHRQRPTRLRHLPVGRDHPGIRRRRARRPHHPACARRRGHRLPHR